MWGFNNVLIYGEYVGSIVFSGTKIHSYHYGSNLQPPEGVRWLNGRGCEVYPAFVDGHVHDRYDEPEKEDPDHLQQACIAGGVGTICCMPNGKHKPFVHPDLLEELEQRWQGSVIKVLYNIAVSRDNLDVISRINDCNLPMLGEVKQYDASTTNAATLIDDLPTQYSAAEAIGMAGKVKIEHAEFEEWIKRNRAQIQRELTMSDHCLIRPSEVEIEGVRQALQVNKDTGIYTHFAHISTPRAVELIDAAKQRGQRVSLETCPQYLSLNTDHLKTLGCKAKMNPAVRSEAERQQMEKYLCIGLIDEVATDHAPHLKNKCNGQESYDDCPSGVPGVQTFGLQIYQYKHRGLMTSERFIYLTSGHAARRYGLAEKGSLLPGSDADVVLINPHETTTFYNSGMFSKCGFTPYHGTTVQGRIACVVLGGKIQLSELPF